ncbi:hypothetical protein DCC79_12435 [bacterium]|nr:hypothetical protein [Chloroflexi bacterium CFX6]RIL08959.1 MAG: hypothetical protein DCC79_12435 [bacterium]
MPDQAAAGAIEADLAAFFGGRDAARGIFDAVRAAVEAAGPAEVRVTRSQVAFRRRRPFAWAWTPDRYLGPGHAPLVLTLSFAQRDPSPRWKQVVAPTPRRFTHHLELWSAADVDDEVRRWVRDAWTAAA